MAHVPHPKNVPGDFYVEDGCCLACLVSQEEAANLVGWDGKHCFVKKQPQTEDEQNSMLDVISVAEADCFRYRGTDLEVLQRLVSRGDREICDSPIARYLHPIERINVRFAPFVEATDPESLVQSFGSHLLTENEGRSNQFEIKARPPVAQVGRLEFRWYGDDYHRVDIWPDQHTHGAFVATITTKRRDRWLGVAYALHRWLQGIASNVRWLTPEELLRGDQGSKLPV